MAWMPFVRIRAARYAVAGFAFGYAVAGFVPNQGLRTKPGGAERDRTVDLLNAIRTAVFDPDRRCLTRIHSVNDRVERQSGHCPFFFDRGSSRLVSLDSAYSLTRGA